MVAERGIEPGAHQLVHAGQERGQGLARAGRRGDQDVLVRADPGPACPLRLGRCAEPLAEPARHERVKRVEDVDHSTTA